MPVTRLGPLGDQGVRKDVASTQSKWRNLQNCVFHHGELRVRPGVEQAGPNITTASTEAGIPVLIAAIDEPTTTGTSEVGETIRPNATSSNNWTLSGAATAHQCLDDNPPDNFSTKIVSASETSKVVLGLGNTTKSYDSVTAAIIRFRAHNVDNLGIVSYLKVMWGATDAELDTVRVYACSEGGAEPDIVDWQEFAVVVTEHPTTGYKLRSSDIDGMSVGIQLVGAPTGLAEAWAFLGVAGDGANTDFGTYSDMLTATGFGSDETPISWFSDSTTWIGGDMDVGDRQSFTFKDLDDDWTAVDTVEVRFDLRAHPYDTNGWRPSYMWHPTYARLFHEGTDDSITYIDSQSWVSGDPESRTLRTVELDEDPATGAAWTIAGVNNAKFGVEYLGPDDSLHAGRRLYIDSAEIYPKGEKTITGKVEIDYVAVDVFGPSNSNSAIASHDRIFATSKNFYRMESETPQSQMTDVSSTTTTSTAPANRQWDWAVLYGQLWMTSGDDDLYYYPASSSSALCAEIASKPFGRTMASFASRIMIGDTTSSGTRTPQRVTFSKINDATDWTDDTAGFFDLLNTPGRVVKLLPLDEDTLVAYKTYGIYNIRRTGQDDIPFIPDVIDADVGCVSMPSVKNVVLPDGSRGHIFLGQHPTLGYSVFLYNGQAAINIGESIREEIRDNWEPEQRQRTFAGVDPRLGHYYLFYPNAGEQMSNRAWVYDIGSGAWTNATFDNYYTCAGNWKMSKERIGRTIADADTYLILGGIDGLPYMLDETIFYDAVFTSSKATWPSYPAFQTEAIDGDSGTGHTQVTEDITQTIESGDYILSEETTDSQLNRIFMYYKNKGSVELTIDISIDGGKNFEDSFTHVIGFNRNIDSIQKTVIDIPGEKVGRFIRFRMTCNNINRPLQIVDMFLDWEPRGDAM